MMSDMEYLEEMDVVEDEGSASDSGESEVYVPGLSRPLKMGEKLEFDRSAYEMYHKFYTPYPCLSFAPMLDDVLMEQRTLGFPFRCNLVAGSQAGRQNQNAIYIMQLDNLFRFYDEASDDEDSSSEDEEVIKHNRVDRKKEEPIFRLVRLSHRGDINRLKLSRLHGTPVCAVWNVLRKVEIFNLTSAGRALQTMSSEECIDLMEKPIFTFTGHLDEGYAMDWSSLCPGQFASGDCRKNIHLWKPMDGGTWQVEQHAYSKHKSSVEDIQWSKTEQNVLFSCSSDKSIKVWDTRSKPGDACMLDLANAHEKDVNVISLNALDPLLLSGGDDGVLKVWDLRALTEQKPVAIFSYHRGPITSVEWCPHDKAAFAAASDDDVVTLWDLTAENRNEVQTDPGNIPPQLIFMHLGQKEVKEVHWHSLCEGVLFTTALDGFNILKTISV